MIRIDLLGPLQAVVSGRSVVPSAARPCQVLALLALNSDRLVSKSALLEELWGENPPYSATTLHTYIHQLRRHIDVALGHASPWQSRDILVTERNGYSLRLHSGITDVQEYYRHARRGTAAFESGDFHTAREKLASALALWRSPVLSGIATGPLLDLEALSLDDSRTAMLNRRIEADLRLGRHMEIMGELRTLSIRHPVNENYAAHYMVSLYHAGRVSEALTEFQRIRTTLRDELGVEPAPPLQRLQRAILSGEQTFRNAPLAGVA